MIFSVKDKIWEIIKQHCAGWAFCAKDFLSEHPRNSIDTALFHLEKAGRIRKVCRGIYDYPMFSTILQELAPPDMDQVAAAIARNLNLEIQPTGNAALNYLHLSTQVPAHYTWLWNAAGRSFHIGKNQLHFQKASRKDFSPKLYQSRMLVQALRILGGAALALEMRNKLQASFSADQWEQIRQDTTLVPARIHRLICELAQT